MVVGADGGVRVSVLDVFRRRPAQRSGVSLADVLAGAAYQGISYPPSFTQTLGGRQEAVPSSWKGYVDGVYKRNGVVFACLNTRMALFSEARIKFRRLRSGRPGDLFGTPALRMVEQPWAGGTTGDLLARALQDADLAGNSFIVRRAGGRLQRLRPDYVTIVAGTPVGGNEDIDVELIGYLFHPDGRGGSRDTVALLPSEVAHFAPIPDPSALFAGMSWITPIVKDVMGDMAATDHKLRFFENGATPNMVVKLPERVQPDKFNEWVRLIGEKHDGVENAYKTMYLGGGADATVVGADMQQLDFKLTQGAGETRIAAAAGVPPVIVGLSEGLQAATYSNYAQARRRFADGTMRPLWRNFAASLSRVIEVPGDAELWYDDRDIPALQEDRKDAAQIQQTDAITIRELINAGYAPESVVAAVTNEDFSLLTHTGLVSVQLQVPGATPGAGVSHTDGPVRRQER